MTIEISPTTTPSALYLDLLGAVRALPAEKRRDIVRTFRAFVEDYRTGMFRAPKLAPTPAPLPICPTCGLPTAELIDQEWGDCPRCWRERRERQALSVIR